MNAEIISVGSELLLGQIVNTNAAFLARECAELGINVFYQTTVGDNQQRFFDTLKSAFDRADMLIITGGLGPTKDDLTKETVARFVGEELAHHEESLHYIEAFFKRQKRPMTPNNRKQALVIKGSHVLNNHFGMAPGMVAHFNKKMIILLPGPPKEMNPMFKNEFIPYFKKLLGSKAAITSRVLRFFGIGESQLETDLMDLIDAQTNPTIAPLASDGEVSLRLTVMHESKEERIRLLDEVEKKINERVGSYLYGYGETTLLEQLFLQLQEKDCTIATAESFTGGKFSAGLTSFPGSSEVFRGGIVSYATEVKEDVLGVSKEVVAKHGVVSHHCAVEMAERAKAQFEADVAISFTGAAGPTPQEGKAPGTVYIGIAGLTDTPLSFELFLAGGREAIRERAMKYGCFYLLNELKRWNKTV